jgi:hypothetical protein
VKRALPCFFIVACLCAARATESIENEAPIFICVPDSMEAAYAGIFKSASFRSNCPGINVMVEPDEKDAYFGGEHAFSLYASVLDRAFETYVTRNDGIAWDLFDAALMEIDDEKLPVNNAYESAREEILEQMK